MPKDKEEEVKEEATPESSEVAEEKEETAVEASKEEAPADEAAVETEAEVSAEEPVETSDTSFETPEGFGEEEITTDKTVTVQPLKFTSFEESSQVQGESNKNLDILMDIKLQLTVELGRTELPIKKVLELTRGSIIELEKIAGEPVELYANGKLIAHGEVVVIEDNFGLRITTITEPEDRLKGI